MADPHSHAGDSQGRQHEHHPGHDRGEDHDHDHGHHHGHGHHHVPADAPARAFAIAIALNSVFVLAEFGYGWAADSTALLADAGHNLSDVLGLVLAWGAMVASRRLPSGRFTYGLRSSSILAALGNAMLLLVASGAIALEAVQRLWAPPAVASVTVGVVAALGIAVNGFSAWLFMRGRQDDLNVRGAYLHMAADAAVSLGVVLAGVLMYFTHWYWLDPLFGLVIVGVILVGTWGLLRDATGLALGAVPGHIDTGAVAAYLRGLPGVAGVHDLHVWGLSTTESALTAHLVMPAGYPGDEFVDAAVQALATRFGVHHSTLQVEQGTTAHVCALEAAPAAAARPHAHAPSHAH